MKTSVQFAARSKEADTDCRLEFHANGKGMEMKVVYILPGGPPYKYREAVILMSNDEAAILAKQIIGSMAHSHQMLSEKAKV